MKTAAPIPPGTPIDQGWLRVEIGALAVSREDLKELRERDVLLVDTLTVRVDLRASGWASVLLSSGERLHADVQLGAGGYDATISADPTPAPRAKSSSDGEFLCVNLVFRLFDPREPPATQIGTVIVLHHQPDDPVALSINGVRVGTGRVTTIDGALGVMLLDWRAP